MSKQSRPTYSDDDCRKIVDAWLTVVRTYKRLYKADVDVEVVLEHISKAFPHACRTRPRPRASTLLDEIGKVKQATSRLRTAMDRLSLEAQGILSVELSNFYEPESGMTNIMAQLDWSLFREVVRIVDEICERPPACLTSGQVYPTTGHPGDEVAYQFGFNLCPIYERVTGKQPGRSQNNLKGGETGPFLEFVSGIIVPTQLVPESSIPYLVRQVVERWVGTGKRGRRRKENGENHAQ